MQLSQGSLLGEDCIHGFGKNGDDASASGVPLDVVEEDATPSMARSSASPALRRCLGGFSKWMGKDHGTGAIYGFVNWSAIFGLLRAHCLPAARIPRVLA
ncbi:unnamed protein product [Effrenium voratum]|uniref:Uncharacterized protein n=1 Tax=Effrenium voratum TaxID=2562239 RepID=A0AA36J216_9DINO|nr:unnamed protein product [Effrenium voratum]